MKKLPGTRAEKRKANRLKNLDKCRERDRKAANEWREKNKEKWNAYCKALRENKPEKVREYRKAYFEKNPLRVIELRKLSYIRRREKIAEYNKEWYSRNKDKVLKRNSEYESARRKIDPAFKCERLLRNRIIEVIKYQRTIKFSKTKELIGCDRECLVKWIEAKFTSGMTWANHGVHGWHIDHIRPCASFDLSDPEQQKQCFNYTNLQPLWAIDNKEKADKWEVAA